MGETVENLDQWSKGVASDELPYHEAMCRLYELCDRYGNSSVSSIVGSASEKHLEATGHRLAFGCCADQDSIMAALHRQERRLLRELERERGAV